MGIVASLLRRNAATGGRGGEEEEHKAAVPPTAKGFKEKAFSHALAKNWKEAALAFGEQAAYDLELGNELSAASALLRSAKCYTRTQDEDEGTVAATKLALEKALELFVKRNDLQMAAVTCEELAELYIEQHELQPALDFFQQAAVYYGSHRRSRQCRFEADRIQFVMDNKETHRQSSEADWTSQLDEALATGLV